MLALLVAVLSAGLSVLLIVLLKPMLVRYALARPNARSSHVVPTPQGGGIAVLAATLAAAAVAGVWSAGGALPVVAAGAVVLAVVGAVDDIRPLPTLPRLLLQLGAVGAVVILAADGGRVLPEIVPLRLEQALLILAGVWFVNLVNFMDGLDWITVAEMVPVTLFLAAFGLAGVVPWPIGLVAAALGGAMLGFAPFNKPVAKLFLGDVGSLPVGLLVGWMLLALAQSGALAAALLLPLYYLADATLTLLRRLRRGEKVWQAHRTHFYQRATDNGLSSLDVSRHVLAVNLGLGLLATLCLVWPWPSVQAGALLAGAGLVAAVLRRFARGPAASATRSPA